MSEKVLKCFNCGESGHISANCQQEAKEPQKGSRSKAQKGSSNQSKKGTETRNSNIISKNKKALKGPVERVCWHCGSKGHRRDACPDVNKSFMLVVDNSMDFSEACGSKCCMFRLPRKRSHTCYVPGHQRRCH